MSDNRDMRQAASGTARGGRAAARGAVNTVKLSVKHPIAALFILGLALFLLLLSAIVGGTSSAPMDETHFLTAKNAEKVTAPQNDDELSSVYTRKQSLDMTVKLANIIEEEKKKDRAAAEAQYRKTYSGKNITFECDTDTMPVYVCDDIDGYGTPYMNGGSEYVPNPELFVSNTVQLGEAKGPYGGLGDNSGKEVYYHDYGGGSWDYCIRAKDNGMKLRLAEAMIKACENDNIGCENYPAGLDCYYEAEKVDWDISRISNKTSTQHSYIINVCLRSAGVKEKYAPADSSSSAIWNRLKGSRQFRKITVPKKSSLLPGDILIKNGGAGKNAGYAAMVVKTPNRVSVQASAGSGGGGNFGASVVKWVDDTVALKRYGYKVFENPPAPESMCPICHPGSGDGWNCIGFAWASWHHGGGLKESNCNNWVIANQDGDALINMSITEGSAFASEKVGVPVTIIKNGGAGIPENMLQPGDVILMYSGSVYFHTAVYLGNNRYGESSSPGSLVSADGNYASSQSSVKLAIRYAGSGGGTSGYTKKDTLTTLQEIGNNTGRRFQIGDVEDANCAQSFAFVNNMFAVSYVQTNHAPGYVQLVDRNGKQHGRVRCDEILHANGACATHDGKYMVAGRLGGNRRSANVFNVTDGEVSIDNERPIPQGASSIAYDREKDTYCLKVWNKIHLYSDQLYKEKKTITATYHESGTFFQDIGAGHGYIFVCFTSTGSRDSENSGTNWIDIYDESTGDYCGSYFVNYGELESCDIVNGELVLLVHISGNKNYIQFTGIHVDEAGNSGGTGVTETDMDILSAYSISLANTELSFNKDEDAMKQGDNLLSHRYTDINGKPVKTYWFGEDRGKVNYERDLKSKVKKWTFYDRSTEEVTINGDNVRITLKELPAHRICRPMFGVDPWAYYVNAMARPKALTEDEKEAALKEETSDVAYDSDDSAPDDIGTKITNAQVLYAMSKNTAELLFTGMVERDQTTGSVYSGGPMMFPLPDGSWTQTDVFGSYESIRSGRAHAGVDLGAATGTPIYSATAGTVKSAGPNGGYGNCVVISSGNMDIYYGHMSSIEPLSGFVNAGQKIGEVGSTGNSTGPHLHFEIRIDGSPTDPAPYLGNGVK